MSEDTPAGRLAAAFERARAQGSGALIAYAMAGDPDLPRSLEHFVALVEGGAAVLEVGIPWSDPSADGPVLQEASQRALLAGASLRRVLDELVPALRARAPQVPLVAMGYYNTVLALGEQAFARRAREAGLSGAIVPDLPIEECEPLATALEREGLALVQLCAPTTPEARARAIAERARGFVYCVSVAGVTGARAELPAELPARLALLRSFARVPVVAGFGVSTAEQARALRAHCDGVVVGSALVRAHREGGAAASRALCATLAEALRGAGVTS